MLSRMYVYSAYCRVGDYRLSKMEVQPEYCPRIVVGHRRYKTETENERHRTCCCVDSEVLIKLAIDESGVTENEVEQED